jgi:hypothetical protein
MIHAPLRTERKAGPPRFLAVIVGALTPRECRHELAVELLSNYTTLSRYCIDATRRVYDVTRNNVYKARSRTRMIGDLACVFIAFNMLPVASLAGILIITALTLLWRDGHTYPPDTSSGGAAADAIVLGAALVSWQLFCLLAANPFVAPRLEFLLGLPFSMAMVAGWRFNSQWKRKPKPTRTEAERAYRDAWRIYILWMVAAAALITANTRIVVGGDVRDVFYVVVPFTWFVIGARLQSERIGGGLFDWKMIWFGKNLEKLENAERATHLFSKRLKSWRDFSPVHFCEGMFFLSIALEILVFPIGVLLGRTPADPVNWFILPVDAAVFVILAGMWIELKKVHERVAAVLVAGERPRRFI